MKTLMTKIFMIGALVLALFIPLAMVESLVEERQERRELVVAQMARVWGPPQTLAGPFLETATGRPALVPDRLVYRGDLQTEVRSKGIYRIPFYSAALEIEGEFPPAFGVKTPTLFLDVGDKKAVEIVRFVVDGKPLVFVDRGDESGRLVMRLPGPAQRFQLQLKVQGIERLHFRPAGDFAVELKSDWPDPSFTGAYLPVSREISAGGFTAGWKIRQLMSAPITLQPEPPPLDLVERGMITHKKKALATGEDFPTAFGVDLFLPVDIYQQATRSVKYGILFVGLTFLAFFLFEVLAELRIHPLQYLLVGSALCIFYLLLLSFAEQIGFAGAYLTGAIATIALITSYNWSVLRQGGRALLLGLFLALLYGFLFALLLLEQYSLLLGSVALFAILAAVMFLTRKIDWYELPIRDRPGPVA